MEMGMKWNGPTDPHPQQEQRHRSIFCLPSKSFLFFLSFSWYVCVTNERILISWIILLFFFLLLKCKWLVISTVKVPLDYIQWCVCHPLNLKLCLVCKVNNDEFFKLLTERTSTVCPQIGKFKIHIVRKNSMNFSILPPNRIKGSDWIANDWMCIGVKIYGSDACYHLKWISRWQFYLKHDK